MNTSENINIFWAELMVEELVRNGITLFIISPGSRSTPLTVAAARNSRCQTEIGIDERGAAFYALGFVKASGHPAVLICTSGTATANYFPAIIEAAMTDTPLIVLTADRPPELQHTGANQTILQDNLYGDYVRWRCTLPCPDDKIAPEYVLSTIDWAVFQATHAPKGPVQLNCMFREPLAPVTISYTPILRPAFLRWRSGNLPYTQYQTAPLMVSDHHLTETAHIINSAKSPLLILGPMSVSENDAIIRLADLMRCPIHCDVLHPLRYTKRPGLIWDDLLLISEKRRRQYQPDVVVHLGGQLLSKRVQQGLEESAPKHYIHVHESIKRIDPGHLTTLRLVCSPQYFAAALLDKITPKSFAAAPWNTEDIQSRLDEFLYSKNELSEPAVARCLSSQLPDHHALFIANSMPIRDLNMFAQLGASHRWLGGNRGASGIDGLIATAAGFFAGLRKPGTLLIGDLAFLHDLNSLHQLNRLTQPIIIVLINNHGGGIFSMLPISRYESLLPFFATPHTLTFADAAKLFGLVYEKPQSMSEFIAGYQSALRRNSHSLVEIITDQERNAEIHRQCEQFILNCWEDSQ